MDREFALMVLVPFIVGATSLAFGVWKRAPALCASGRRMERTRWHQLWRPLLPAGLAFALLAGWALVEPDDSEKLPTLMTLGAGPFAIIWLRAVVRALRSVRQGARAVALGTVGLVRPSIVVDPDIAHHLDEEALSAALAHEQAHARHRDPLRIWCAQIATDLQWPSRAAVVRLTSWREALEIARDEEARDYGADGADLAAAIVTVARHVGRAAPCNIASLTGAESALKRRMERLLAPMSAAGWRPHEGDGRWAMLGFAFVIAIVTGARFGETVMHALTASR